jgi:23S rRNA (uracil1939-C5)-methyltransferase
MVERIEIVLKSIASTGEAVGENPENGKPVFVADAIPGERVEVEITENRAQWQRGRLHRVVEASPDRIRPPCPYFGPPQPVILPDGDQLNPEGVPRCAGCLWQHISYDRQLALKRSIVVAQLAELAELAKDPRRSRSQAESLVAEVIGLADPADAEDRPLDFHYLTQMTFALDEQGNLCLPTRRYDRQTPLILPIEFCPLHHPQLADLFSAFVVDEEMGQDLARDLLTVEMSVGATAEEIGDGDEGMIVLESRGREAPSLELELPVNVLLRQGSAEDLGSVSLLIGDMSYPVALGDERFVAYPPMGRSPIVSAHALGEEALGAVVTSVLELQPFDHLLHLWAGTGLISLAVAQQVATVIAAEDDELSLAALEANTAGAENVDIHRGPVRRILDHLRRGSYESNVALLTPRDEPVEDLHFRHLDSLNILRVAVISDDATELARLVPVARSQRYELVAVQPVDLQPQQETVTLVARFDRRR